MSQFGLLGKKLGHSFSKIIHEKISPDPYDLIECDELQLHEFMTKKDFKGVNVTIPYKQTVMQYLDVIDPHAREIGAVNTVVNQNGVLYGYNTDYDGFAYLLDHHHIDVTDKKVLIIGNGGAARAVKAVCRNRNAQDIVCVCRHPKGDSIGYDQVYAHHTDARILINTSPVGMYPKAYAQPVNLDDFPDCEAVVDVVYNPLNTAIVLQAKRKGLTGVCGLEMLIVQAIRARERFSQQTFSQDIIQSVYTDILAQRFNLVLIGMPSAGKSTIGQAMAKELNKPFLDLDAEIENYAGCSIKEIFAQNGEEEFRRLETQITRQYAIKQGQVIACGGGIITKKENIDALRMNGILLFIDRDFDLLVQKDPNRPLSASPEAVKLLYEKRQPLYQAYCDIHILNNGNLESVVQTIKQKTKEYIKTIGGTQL